MPHLTDKRIAVIAFIEDITHRDLVRIQLHLSRVLLQRCVPSTLPQPPLVLHWSPTKLRHTIVLELSTPPRASVSPPASSCVARGERCPSIRDFVVYLPASREQTLIRCWRRSW
ncbi:hypothetical protein FIBSPDRAFT_422115 [Athelia psychrophila]|uniref:Uncharacterized protein n=1 Tax=Athelia psychrophila TaxID=1759441 RepID=A0A166MVU4_9AGAM|nr:hypothetical protein FIBSPDRAFT_422115 [Fibularhizoctonia sp. CBS 109695]